MEPFSASYNAVVGRNGAGKSNFFSAIRFVLNDAYTKLTPEERQELLHEGSGPSTMSAFVEIVFDNADGRFPTGKDEVVLRRTIGLKKDEFSLDKKTITKSDVMNLLQSAGFSKSNPYYIVPQGRITSLTNAKDSERLQLLKEVAGTQVYEDHRQESLKIMEETDLKRNKIEELLQFIDERLSELEEEKEELKQYQELDKEKRCLEYSIYSQEQTEINEDLEELDESFKNENSNLLEQNENLKNNLDRVNEVENEIKKLKRVLQGLELERNQLSLDKNSEIKEKSKFEMANRHLQKQTQQLKEDKVKSQKELKEIESQIKDRELSLRKVMPQYEASCENESKLKIQLAKCECERDAIYSKLGRVSEFKSVAERDKWIKNECKEIEKSINNFKQQEKDNEKDLNLTQNSVQELEKEVSNMSVSEKERKKNLDSIESEIRNLKQSRDQLTERRKELWREESKTENVLHIMKEEHNKAERHLSAVVDKNTSLGLAAVKRIVSQHNLKGVYGPLYELFEVDEIYETAVDVVAGQSLFHVVVEDDVVASKLLEIMIQEKSGRITFMPLNRLRPDRVDYPKSDEAIPLVRKLRFDSKLSSAFHQVFGKAVVCPDLIVAANVSRSYNLNAITLEGDRVDKKGALTGGFIDNKKSRLEIIKSLKSWKQKLANSETALTNAKQEIQTCERDVTKYVGMINQLEDRKRKIGQSFGEIESKQKELDSIKRSFESKKKLHESLKFEMSSLETKLELLKKELKTNLAVSPEEESKLKELYSNIESVQKQVAAANQARNQLETEKMNLENELNLNLRKRKLELIKKMEESSGNEEFEKNLAKIEKFAVALEDFDKRESEIETEMDETAKQIRECNSKLETLRSACAEKHKLSEQAQIFVDKYLTKKNFLLQKKDDCVKKIRELGILPEDAFEKYRNTASATLIKKLHVVNEKLTGFVHVNKKAYDQYSNFTKQRDSLLKRQEELDDSSKSIQDFIKVLDQRKDEAITNTFKQVQVNFAEIFEQLVPNGKGSLVMLRDEEASQSTKTGIQYSGVGINVSFLAKNEEGARMQQLSGGQKSLVALALIFSIQKCDPAPFYLFDEIDANLDTAYRASVANLIKEFSKQAQFIMTTFRPELLQHADKFYGVSFVNKVSSIECISKESALEFVEREVVSK